MTSQSPTPYGHPLAATAVVGSFACALVLVMRVAGLLTSVDAGLAREYVGLGFGVEGSGVEPAWAVPLVVLLVYGVVWLVFETPGTGRRVMLLLTALVLTVALSPVLALWGAFWSPVSAGLGVVLGGLCAILWARQHRMPCELPVSQELRGGKIIPMQNSKREDKQGEASRGRAGKGGRKRQQRQK